MGNEGNEGRGINSFEPQGCEFDVYFGGGCTLVSVRAVLMHPDMVRCDGNLTSSVRLADTVDCCSTVSCCGRGGCPFLEIMTHMIVAVSVRES